MYLVYYGDQFVFDPYSDDRKIHDGKLSGDVNTYMTLKFTIPPTNPEFESITARDYSDPVMVTFDDQELFRGYVEETEEQLNTELKVTCKGDLAMLEDTVVRPYSTDQGEASEQGLTYVAAGFANYFTWLINSHNSRMTAAGCDEKTFAIAYPSGSNTNLATEGAKLDDRGNNYRSSTSKPTTLGEIKDKILDSLNAYIQLWYSDSGTKCLALYADVPENLKNNQTVQFGVNITDYTLNNSCVDLYTAIRPEGATDTDGNTVTLASLPDGVKQTDYYKKDDVLYHIANVEKYGYREYAWSSTESADANSLLASSIVKLQQIMSPTQGIDVGALDMAFIDSEYKHLLPGQEVTVLSYVHNIDLELLVASCDIDFDSPGSTSYSFGSSATRISKTYGQIIQDISVSDSDTETVRKIANSANATAQNAAQLAVDATSVSVSTQQSEIETFSEGDFITPASGVDVVSAHLAKTGSVRQLSANFDVLSVVQSGQELGTLQEAPAVVSLLAGDAAGLIDTDGKIVAGEQLTPGEYSVSAVYVRSMQ